MDKEAMIDAVVARVAEKLAALEQADASREEAKAVGRERQPGLLVISRGLPRQDLLRSERLAEYFYTASAPRKDHPANMDTVQVVVLYDLTVGNMVKLAEGHCDTPYTALAARALLMGKRMYAPREAVELYRYEDTAPAAYYRMLAERLALLEASGLTICPEAELEERILRDHLESGGCRIYARPAAPPAPVTAEPSRPAPEPPAAEEIVVTVTKRALTERDVADAAAKKAAAVRVRSDCILTELAKELAKRQGIRIVRDGGTEARR